ncbi:MAG: class E sortase [Acidimicrobiales bacterium]
MLTRVLGGVGRTLITCGTLILLFVAYQLWGTGLQASKSQDQLAKEWQRKLDRIEATSTTTTTTAPPTTTTTTPGTTTPTIQVKRSTPRTADLPLPKTGEPIAVIRIPAIHITRTVVESVDLSQLKRGPGHYPETPLPGQAGNVAIAGHRTTYGQPFHNIDKLRNGDQITFETAQGTFVYEVTGHLVVSPKEVSILEDKKDDRVTLIACHPKYSASQRYIVVGKLVGKPAPPLTGQEEQRQKLLEQHGGDELAGKDTIDGGLSGNSTSKRPAVLWGLLAAFVWFACWLAQVAIRRTMRRTAEDEGRERTRFERLAAYSPYLIGVPLFLVVLYVFFENFARLLPGNY